MASKAPAADKSPEELPTHIAMHHPDGGTCDSYDTEKGGHIMVPVADVASMADHGFLPGEA
jgi:hypothetical protein